MSCSALRTSMSVAGCVMGGRKQVTIAFPCQCSIVLDAACYTSDDSSYIDAVTNQKKADYVKQYRLKSRLLMQQDASTPSETKLLEKDNKGDYAKQYRLKRQLLTQQQDLQKQNKRIPSIFNDRITGSCVCIA